MSKTTIPGIYDTADVKARVITVTPSLAKEWLKLNKKNRNMKSSAIRKYALDMAEGRWQFTAEPIKFDTNGTLLDGQHRLYAIASQRETFTIELLVVTGLEPEAQSAMDQGTKRTGGDVLQLAGVKNANMVASAAKYMILWDTGLMFRDSKVQHAHTAATAIAEWAEAHPEDVRAMSILLANVRKSDTTPSPALAAATLIWRYNPDARELVTTFFDLLGNGGASRDSAVNALTQKLRLARKNSQVIRSRDQMGLIITAWNAYVVGKPMKSLRIPGGTYTSKTFPKITIAA